MYIANTKQRYWSKVSIKGEDECWDWLASLSSVGYGAFSIKNIQYSSHRIAWEFTNGKIPEGKLVLHKCDNRKCCNPNHLYIGTHSDNICDAITRNRGGFKAKPKYDTSISALVHASALLACKIV